MKLVANKPCNLNGKKYFIGEEVPVEEVVDYASLVKMGLLSVIQDPVQQAVRAIVAGPAGISVSDRRLHRYIQFN